MNEDEFRKAFGALAGTPGHFPWQWELYKRFIAGDIPPSCNLPTGLGKTSVIHVWLLALATNPKALPRRLVYVVNRRTVVDQTTNEVENLRKRLPDVFDVFDRLCSLCATEPEIPYLPEPLAISTLRGQFADNREWSADPSRPSVICGTVDMIGSRLLFSGYGCGFKTRPLHAGFLGQDALIVHDEAHLDPAFQKLLLAIEKEQERCKDFRPLKVMELTATSRAGGEAFELTKEEKEPPATLPEPPTEPIHHVWRRLKAKKGLHFRDEKRGDVAKKIGQLARDRKASGQAILVFVRTIDDVKTVQDELAEKKGGVPAAQIQVLTGTLRGLERDRLASSDPVFARFLPKPKVATQPGTVYLICTSAGEVGVDISADHMVCDLTTLDSMAQRLGRVNRRGDGAAEVDVVCESDPDPKKKDDAFEKARWKTKEILERLPRCDWTADRREAAPLCLRDLKPTEEERKTAFAPEPTILPVSDILFDAWALTTIRDKLPGRPKVEPYLHGVAEWQPPETHVAWREEVWELRLKLTSDEDRKQNEASERKRLAKSAEDLLEDYPLKPHELLRDRSDRVFKHLTTIATRHPTEYVWLVDDEGSVEVFTLKELADKDKKDRIDGRTVLFPPEVGGLRDGLLDGSATVATGIDVADEWYTDDTKTVRRRQRLWDNDSAPSGMRRVRKIDTKPDRDEAEEESTGRRFWYWNESAKAGDGDGSKNTTGAVTWETHTKDVVKNTKDIVGKLSLDALEAALIFAAECHDLGKKRKLFQTVLGNRDPSVCLAKSGKKGGRIAEKYRHEFGSLIDTANPELAPGFSALNDDLKAFVLHVIAAHHGRGRPHFPADEAFDPGRSDAEAKNVAREVPRRFARLQRKYGRWGLAYLESLLRAADYAASASPSAFVAEGAK